MPTTPESAQDSELVVFAAAARYLRVSPTTLERIVRSGKLPVVRTSRQRTFKRADLDYYIEARRSTAPGKTA
jgi:excisionase family DNA binding protein